jgi:hypothetical protein
MDQDAGFVNITHNIVQLSLGCWPKGKKEVVPLNHDHLITGPRPSTAEKGY